MNDYKGIYYDANSELKSFEGGAHFKYSELCQQLEEVLKCLPKSRHGRAVFHDEDNSKPKQSRNDKTLLQSLTLKLSEITKDKNEINYNKTVELVTKSSKYQRRNQSQNPSSSNPKANILIQEGAHSLKPKPDCAHYNSKDTRNKIQIDFGRVGCNTKNESFSQGKVSIPYNSSSFHLNNSNILLPKQNKRFLYQLIQNQKTNNKSISHTNEISSLSDLNSSAQDEVKVQGSNIIVQPKINISFVNNINTLGIPIDQRSRNIKQGHSLMKMNTSIKKENINLYCTNQHPPFAQQTATSNANGNFTCKNKTPSPMKGRAAYQKGGSLNGHQFKDKPKILQTQANSNLMKYFNISKKYSALQKRINQMKLKTRNDLTKISVDFEHLISQKKISSSLAKKNKDNSLSKKQSSESNVKAIMTATLTQPKPVPIKSVTIHKPLIRNIVPLSSSKSYIRKSLNQNNSFLTNDKRSQPK